MEFVLKRVQKGGVTLSGKRVAIVGGGPAGLAAANELLNLGHDVHVYDQMPEPGGLLLFGIPEHRINKESVRECVRGLKSCGVDFRCGVKVGYDIKFSDLIVHYDAILVATGAWKSKEMGIQGEHLKGVHYALDYIVRYNLAKLGYLRFSDLPALGDHVVIVGGGLTAVDACMMALERGASDVTLIYRRTRAHAPAGRHMMGKLIASGIRLRELTQPVEFIGDDRGKVVALKAVKMQLLEIGVGVRPKAVPIIGSEHLLEVDSVLLATGLSSSLPFNGEGFSLETDERRKAKVVDAEGSELKKVFVAGDALYGPSYVAPAVQSGIRAAASIHQILCG
ncbi:MAG: FAD-dependent oxidoreductase [Nitrososphaeria archaeon]